MSLTLGSTGKFTGKLILNGTTYTLNNAFDAHGDFSGMVGKPAVPVVLHIDSSGISGSVDGRALSTYHATYVRGQPIAEVGRYTLLLKPTDTAATVPQGTGYATLTVSATGAVSAVGKLADGTAFSAASILVGGPAGKLSVFSVPLSYPSVSVRGMKEPYF